MKRVWKFERKLRLDPLFPIEDVYGPCQFSKHWLIEIIFLCCIRNREKGYYFSFFYLVTCLVWLLWVLIIDNRGRSFVHCSTHVQFSVPEVRSAQLGTAINKGVGAGPGEGRFPDICRPDYVHIPPQPVFSQVASSFPNAGPTPAAHQAGVDDIQIFCQGHAFQPLPHLSQHGSFGQKVDLEVRRILDEQYAIAKKLIEDNKDKMHTMAKALLEWETIDAEQVQDIMEGKPPRPPKDWTPSNNKPPSGPAAPLTTDGAPAAA